MGILNSAFKIPSHPLYNVGNPEHCLMQALLIVPQHS